MQQTSKLVVSSSEYLRSKCWLSVVRLCQLCSPCQCYNYINNYVTCHNYFQIKEGGVYELLITTVSGLYRHRIGDVVRVTHFEGQCPVIEFMYRYVLFIRCGSDNFCFLLDVLNNKAFVSKHRTFSPTDVKVNKFNNFQQYFTYVVQLYIFKITNILHACHTLILTRASAGRDFAYHLSITVHQTDASDIS